MDYEQYKNTDPYPDRPAKPVLPSSKVKPATPSEYRAYAAQLEEYEKAMVEFRAALAVWNKKQGGLEDQFKVDALREAGLEGHPKADIVYRKAWEHGHASGLSDVVYWLQEFAEVVL